MQVNLTLFNRSRADFWASTSEEIGVQAGHSHTITSSLARVRAYMIIYWRVVLLPMYVSYIDACIYIYACFGVFVFLSFSLSLSLSLSLT